MRDVFCQKSRNGSYFIGLHVGLGHIDEVKHIGMIVAIELKWFTFVTLECLFYVLGSCFYCVSAIESVADIIFNPVALIIHEEPFILSICAATFKYSCKYIEKFYQLDSVYHHYG